MAYSSDDNSQDFVPYAQRPEWKDVTPIYLNDAETAVVNIAYSERYGDSRRLDEFNTCRTTGKENANNIGAWHNYCIEAVGSSDTLREVFAYFRAILQSEEKSERVLELTSEAAWLNPANYTLWQYRRAVLKELNKNFNEELKFVGELIEDNPKNYQLWYHRRVIVEITRDAAKELDFTDHMLRDDSKNYHAWQHRQWVVKEFDMWADELDFAGKAIADDLRNNSAWNYRYFVISSTTAYTLDVLEREVRLCMDLIRKAPHNESAWNYFSGIFEQSDPYTYPGVWEFCLQLSTQAGCKAPYLVLFMVECLRDQAEKATRNEAQKLVDQAVKLCDDLTESDPVRKGYYRHLKEKLLKLR